MVFAEYPEPGGIPGLDHALDVFTSAPLPQGLLNEIGEREYFDMSQYRQYILDITCGCIVHFEGMSQLVADQRLDRIYRFITVVFMQHNGEVTIEQEADGEIILRGK